MRASLLLEEGKVCGLCACTSAHSAWRFMAFFGPCVLLLLVLCLLLLREGYASDVEVVASFLFVFWVLACAFVRHMCLFVQSASHSFSPLSLSHTHITHFTHAHRTKTTPSLPPLYNTHGPARSEVVHHKIRTLYTYIFPPSHTTGRQAAAPTP